MQDQDQHIRCWANKSAPEIYEWNAPSTDISISIVPDMDRQTGLGK